MKSTSAICAKQIREELKKAFPETMFSVTSKNFSGGNSVSIRWENNETQEEVEALVKKYQYGHFDSMQDLYEYDNKHNGIQQVKYVLCSRTITDDKYRLAIDYIIKHFSGCENMKPEDMNKMNNELNEKWGACTLQNLAYRFIRKINLNLPIETAFNN